MQCQIVPYRHHDDRKVEVDEKKISIQILAHVESTSRR